MLYTTLGLNFTMKWWAESLVLMSFIIHGPCLEQTHLLRIIWWYCLWPACPCLSWSTVALSRSIGVELVHWTWICFSTCANLKSFISACSFQTFGIWSQADIHTHASCNAVLLVWSLLRLTPIIGIGAALASSVLPGSLFRQFHYWYIYKLHTHFTHTYYSQTTFLHPCQ